MAKIVFENGKLNIREPNHQEFKQVFDKWLEIQKHWNEGIDLLIVSGILVEEVKIQACFNGIHGFEFTSGGGKIYLSPESIGLEIE